MRDEWFRAIELPLNWKQFHELPRNAAYKYEYFDDHAWLSPRPKSYHAVLPLTPRAAETRVDVQGPIAVRPLEDADWEDLPLVFAVAFARVPPFSSMEDEERRQAGRACLEHTRDDGDGPLIRQACFVAMTEDHHLVGAILVTLAPRGDLTEFGSLHWRKKPPKNAVERRLGRAHVTWVFVAPMFAGHGVGSAMLSSAVNGLVGLGYTELVTTFISGNDSSMLWHWRNGFELAEYGGSLRGMRRRIQGERDAKPRRSASKKLSSRASRQSRHKTK